jgi:hypothetical protein
MRRGAAISILVERGRRAASSPLVFNREPMQGSPLVALNWPCDGSSLTLGTRCSWPHRVQSVVNVTCNRAPASRYVIVAQHEPAAIAACPAQSTRHSLRITCIRWGTAPLWNQHARPHSLPTDRTALHRSSDPCRDNRPSRTSTRTCATAGAGFLQRELSAQLGQQRSAAPAEQPIIPH